VSTSTWIPPGFADHVRTDITDLSRRYPAEREKVIAAYLGALPLGWAEAALGRAERVISSAVSIPLLAKIALERGDLP